MSKSRGRPKDPDLSHRRCREILQAATGVFASEGYRNTDMQSIADAAGVSKGTLYTYYESKEKLFLSACRLGVELLSEKIEASYDKSQSFLDRLPKAIHAYLVFFDENPEIVELLMQERAEFRDRKQSTYFEHKAARSAKFTSEIEADIRDGKLRDLPVNRVKDVVGDLLYGTIFANHFRGRIKSLEAQSEDIIDVLMNGIASSEKH